MVRSATVKSSTKRKRKKNTMAGGACATLMKSRRGFQVTKCIELGMSKNSLRNTRGCARVYI